MRVTAETYGHLIPSGHVGAIDSLNAKTSPQNSATQTQPGVRCRRKRSRSKGLVDLEGSNPVGRLIPRNLRIS